MSATSRAATFRANVMRAFQDVCDTGDAQGLRALLSDPEVAAELGKSDTLEAGTVAAAFHNYDQNIGVLNVFMRMFSNSRLDSIFTCILVNADGTPHPDRARTITRYFLRYTRTLGMQGNERGWLHRALGEHAWPIVMEMQSFANQHVLLEYLVANQNLSLRDSMPANVRQALIQNASLEELDEIRARLHTSTRIRNCDTYREAMEQSALRQEQRLVLGMMTHEGLSQNANAWQRNALENRDVLTTIRDSM